jgi:putative membrane protein
MCPACSKKRRFKVIAMNPASRIIAIATAILVASGAAALAQSGTPSDDARRQPLSGQDKQFLSYAAEDNQAEIQLCLLAEKKAHDLALKAFARLMVNDHVGVESRLAALANGEQIELPNGNGEEGDKTLSKMQSTKTADFDGEFLKAQIEDHANDVKKFSDIEKTTQNEGVKRFAAETLPILQQHARLAKAVKASL